MDLTGEVSSLEQKLKSATEKLEAEQGKPKKTALVENMSKIENKTKRKRNSQISVRKDETKLLQHERTHKQIGRSPGNTQIMAVVSMLYWDVARNVFEEALDCDNFTPICEVAIQHYIVNGDIPGHFATTSTRLGVVDYFTLREAQEFLNKQAQIPPLTPMIWFIGKFEGVKFEFVDQLEPKRKLLDVKHKLKKGEEIYYSSLFMELAEEGANLCQNKRKINVPK